MSPRLNHVLAASLVAGAALLAGCDKVASPSSSAGAASGAVAGVGNATATAGTSGTAPAKFNAVDLTGAEYAHDLKLADPDGKTRTLADWKGDDVVVFFGYTHCPDACPTMLADLAAAKKAMGPDGAKVQVVFVTVDPARDTAALMKAYAANFGPQFIGLRGDDAQTQATAKEFKVFYAKVPGKTPDDYTMDHTAGAYVFDPAGRLRLFMRGGSTPETMAEDFKALLHGA